MSCDPFRELISAELDGETTETERSELATHLATCDDCTTFAADATSLHRASRIAPAATIPDLTDAILDRAGAEVAGHRRRVAVLAFQYGLLVVALFMMVLALPELFASSGDAVHTSRHLGGWDVAFAIGLLLAALQPWRARGLLPMAAALAGVMVVTAVIDIARGATPGLAEGTHLLEVFGLVFLWLLSRSMPAGERPRRARPLPANDSGGISPVAHLRAIPSRFGLTTHGHGPAPMRASAVPAVAVAAHRPDVDPAVAAHHRAA